MNKKQKKRLDPMAKLMLMHETGLANEKNLRKMIPDSQEGNRLDRAARLQHFIQMMTTNTTIKPGHSLAFILYDIENDRVRRYIAKFLESKGYMRVQKSVFFGHIKSNLHQEVGEQLRKVNAVYENGDSLIVIPISQDIFHSLKMIGKNLNFEMSMGTKNTLFF